MPRTSYTSPYELAQSDLSPAEFHRKLLEGKPSDLTRGKAGVAISYNWRVTVSCLRVIWVGWHNRALSRALRVRRGSVEQWTCFIARMPLSRLRALSDVLDVIYLAAGTAREQIRIEIAAREREPKRRTGVHQARVPKRESNYFPPS